METLVTLEYAHIDFKVRQEMRLHKAKTHFCAADAVGA